MWWFIPFLIIVLSLAVIATVLYRKLPQLRILNVDALPEERERHMKNRIILQKLQRRGGARVQSLAKGMSASGRWLSKRGRRAVQKLYRLEQYYQKLQRSGQEGTHAYGQDVLSRLIQEAEVLVRAEEYIPAEKIFIDIISHNPKSAEAYEWLGNLYLQSGQFDQARETLRFALRLAPGDASVNASLAALETGRENYKIALEYIRKSIEKRPKNPKYLDFYIEAALRAGSLKDARKGIATLKKVNSENKKIQEFEKRFDEMKAVYIERTAKADDESSQSK